MIEQFYGIHRNETCIIVCNGLSLRDVPVSFLRKYVSYGCNSIVRHEDFTPNYYATIDDRNRILYNDLITGAKLAGVPKFIPTPNLDHWVGDFFRFKHKPAPYWERSALELGADVFDTTGIFYGNTPQVLMQLAFFMGCTRMLVVGMDHRPYKEGYFWGVDQPVMADRNDDPRFRVWERGYEKLAAGLAAVGVEMWNLTPDSHASAIPHDRLEKWL